MKNREIEISSEFLGKNIIFKYFSKSIIRKLCIQSIKYILMKLKSDFISKCEIVEDKHAVGM